MKDPLEDTEEEVTRRGAATTALLIVFGLVFLAVLNPGSIDFLAIILGIVLMVMFHEAGHYLAAKRAGMKATEFFFGFGPRVWSFTRGETEYGVKAIPAGGYVRIIGMNNLEEVEPEDEPRTYRQGSFGNRVVVVLAGVTVNVLLALVLFFVAFLGQGKPELSTTLRSIVGGTPAAEAGLEAGDRIVSIDGQAVGEWDEVAGLIEDRANEPTAFVVERDGTRRTIEITPRPRTDDNPRGFVGIEPDGRFESLSPVGAARESVATLWRGTTGTVRAIGGLFTPSGIDRYSDNFTGSAPEAGSQADAERPRSIIGIIDLGGTIVDGNLWTLLFLLGAISFALALFNTIPLLPFDGGHAAIAVYERIASAVRGREVRVDVRRLVPVTAFVLAIFLMLALSAAFLDVRDLFSGG